MKLLLALFSYLSIGWSAAAVAAMVMVKRDTRRRMVRVFITGCTVILGAAFFLFGTDKIIGWDSSAAHAETMAFYKTYYGLSPPFMVLTGWIQTVSAVLLIWHRRHWAAAAGAGLIFCTCSAALYFHLAYDPAGPFRGLPSIMGALLSAVVLLGNRDLAYSLFKTCLHRIRG